MAIILCGAFGGGDAKVGANAEMVLFPLAALSELRENIRISVTNCGALCQSTYLSFGRRLQCLTAAFFIKFFLEE